MATLTLFPASFTISSSSNQTLTNPNNALASDGVYATLSDVSDEGFQYEAVFDFTSLPSNAIITAWSAVFKGFSVTGDPVEMRSGVDCARPAEITRSWDNIVGGPYYLPVDENGDIEIPLPLISTSEGEAANVQITPSILKDQTYGQPIMAVTGVEYNVSGADLSLDSVRLEITYTEPEPDPDPQPEPMSSFMTTINMQALAGKPSWFQIPIDYLLFKQAEPFGKFRVADLPKRCAIERIVWEPLVAFGGGSVTTPTIAITDDQLASIVSSINLNTGGNVFATVTAAIDFDSDRYIYIDPALGGGTFANVDRGSGILHVLVSAIPERIVN